MKPKNSEITIGELGKEGVFVSGTKYWRIEWAEYGGLRFNIGTKVWFFDEDDEIEYSGLIDWMIIDTYGNVEVSIADTPLGRIDIESLSGGDLIKIF